MEPILFAPADIIIQKGQRELAMYILAKGRAAVLDPQGQLLKQARCVSSYIEPARHIRRWSGRRYGQ